MVAASGSSRRRTGDGGALLRRDYLLARGGCRPDLIGGASPEAEHCRAFAAIALTNGWKSGCCVFHICMALSWASAYDTNSYAQALPGFGITLRRGECFRV